mgnify:CR=1 FL=1
MKGISLIQHIQFVHLGSLPLSSLHSPRRRPVYHPSSTQTMASSFNNPFSSGLGRVGLKRSVHVAGGANATCVRCRGVGGLTHVCCHKLLLLLLLSVVYPLTSNSFSISFQTGKIGAWVVAIGVVVRCWISYLHTVRRTDFLLWGEYGF